MIEALAGLATVLASLLFMALVAGVFIALPILLVLHFAGRKP